MNKYWPKNPTILEPQLHSNILGGNFCVSKHFTGILSQPAGGGIPLMLQHRVLSSYKSLQSFIKASLIFMDRSHVLRAGKRSMLYSLHECASQLM